MFVATLITSSGFRPSISLPPKWPELRGASVSSGCCHSLVPNKARFGSKCSADSRNSGYNPDNPKVESKNPRRTKVAPDEKTDIPFPEMIPRKKRRGRRSEAQAVEDYVRSSLQRTFDSIREQNPEIANDMEKILKDKATDSDDESSDNEDEDEDKDDSGQQKMTMEEENPDWPLDAEIGWGIRASEYFDRHPIKNIIGEDGSEIDWEGEIDKGLVKEINCLEWESFAFHPSPLIVLVFERYNRSSENWRALKELEKAAEVYWKAKERLPPRTVKVDMNIEKDLAYALRAKECPQILFLRGNKMVYRETKLRSCDELVLMIAHFYYNAKRPSFLDAPL